MQHAGEPDTGRRQAELRYRQAMLSAIPRQKTKPLRDRDVVEIHK